MDEYITVEPPCIQSPQPTTLPTTVQGKTRDPFKDFFSSRDRDHPQFENNLLRDYSV